ncbi:hypothetical protein GCM10008956_00680 [Deinococcus arenae]|uniref:Uncharacterized protein n=1 Tax=Deinococcus arenae TaxID=1452751 RepID=A0A8H9GI69_9DEIO|nr:Ig-like domain-containing protein [Deinococcus arenae]AWT36174.1 hypothetical protein DM785_11850 [Deinococcus actinosclerus]GGM28548.1 hypothetical protein GCM10008956_00680 [Deinococcus arenae]
MKYTVPLLTLTALLMTACGGGKTPDTTGPQLTLTQSTSNQDSSITITASATDTSGVSKVEFYQNGVLKATDTTAPYEYTVNVLNDSRTGFTAKAYDTKGNVSTSAVFNVTTLNQGVWEWGIFDSANNLLDSGVAVYDDEVVDTDVSVALGLYGNDTQTKGGLTLLGNIASKTTLDTVFAATDTSLYFAGQDLDGKFSVETLSTGKSYTAFIGGGTTFDASNNPVQSVGIVMLQTSTEVPQMTATRTATTIQRLAAQRTLGSLSVQPRPVNAAAILNTSRFTKR